MTPSEDEGSTTMYCHVEVFGSKRAWIVGSFGFMLWTKCLSWLAEVMVVCVESARGDWIVVVGFCF